MGEHIPPTKDVVETLRQLELYLCAPTPTSVKLAHELVLEVLRAAPETNADHNLLSLRIVADGVGVWLLHRFGPNTPEGREGQALLNAVRASEKANASLPHLDPLCNCPVDSWGIVRCQEDSGIVRCRAEVNAENGNPQS